MDPEGEAHLGPGRQQLGRRLAPRLARDVNAAPTLTVALDPITGAGACPHGRNGRNSFPTLPVDQAAGDSTGPDRVVVVCIAAPLVLPLPLLLSWLDQHSSLEEERA